MTKILIALGLVAALIGGTAFLVARHYDAAAAEQERSLTLLEARLTILQGVARSAQAQDSAWRVTADSLRQLATRRLANARQPVVLPPEPLAQPAEACAPWVNHLTAKVADLEYRNSELEASAVDALAADSVSTRRADSLATVLDSLGRGIGAARDTLAARPGIPPAPSRGRRIRPFVDVRTDLDMATAQAGAQVWGPLYVAVEQSFPIGRDDPPGRRLLTVGARLTF